jgi:hypothetical protein
MGFCGFRFIGDGPEIELMYGLLPRYWGQGLADPPNTKSIPAMRRLEMAASLL